MNKVKLTGLFAGLALLLAAVAPARAAEEAKPPETYVVLVGVSDYADKQIQPRPLAEADAKALYDLLTSKDHLGVDDKHIRLLLGSDDPKRKSQPATRENILKALHWVATEAKANDLVVFAFFGQGGTLSDSGERRCFFASDSTVKDRSKNAVAAADVGQELDKLKSQRFCALIDVSFKGFKNGDKPAPEPNLGGATAYKEFLGDDEGDDHAALPGRALFLATNGVQQCPDLKDHGAFATAVLAGLKGGADKEGYEPDGTVTVDELNDYIDKELPPLVRNALQNPKNGVPNHFVLGGQGSHFSLTRNPAVSAKVQQRLDKLAQMVKNKEVPDKFAEEGQALLGRMPKLESQRALRKAYQKLVDGEVKLDAFEASREIILAGTKLRRDAALQFAGKVIEATQLIKEGYVKEVNQGEMVTWAVRGLYRRLDEKVPADVAESLSKAKTMKEADLTLLLADVRQKLGKREDLDNHKDIDIALQRMLTHLDPYTTYIDADTLKRFQQDVQGTFTGIGVQIRKDVNTDQILVVTPIKDSPAYKAAILAGDVITKITRDVDSDGKPLPQTEVIETKGLPLNDAVKKILGQPRTKVKLTIEREGSAKPLEFEITRNRVEVETVVALKRKADDNWDWYVDTDRKIGYIRLTSFSRNSYRDLSNAVRELRQGGVKGLVLDLRFNPGGLLDSAVKISDLFIDDGAIVSIKPRVGQQHTFKGEKQGSLLDFPMVCLVNGNSASGSEIVAACLQDHHRAVVMGERSYGKGSVQNIQPFEGGELKLTTASFWRPSLKNLNKSSTAGKDDEDWGVKPDGGFAMKLSRKERDDLDEHQHNLQIIPRRDRPPEVKPEFKDKQLDMALEYLRGQIKTASRVPEKKAG